MGLGFGPLKEGPYNPALAFIGQRNISLGKIPKVWLPKKWVDSTGAGSFETTFSLNIFKSGLVGTLHPMNIRASFNYTIPHSCQVHGFNTYGGGYGTHGKFVRGNASKVGLAMNIALRSAGSLHWMSFIRYTLKTTFSGKRGCALPRENVQPWSERLLMIS